MTLPKLAKFTIDQYLTRLKMSKLPVILVEGKDDSIFFQLICDELLKVSKGKPIHKILSEIEFDTPAQIKSPPERQLGNREKVEYVCKRADEIQFTGQLIGFTDREFREFDIINGIDHLQSQKHIGRVIWSRGHSIENHLFDFEILRDGLRDYGISTKYPVSKALKLFEQNFDAIIRIACGISLGAYEINWQKKVSGFLDNSILSFEDNSIKLDFDKWDKFLKKKMKLDDNRRNQLLTEIKKSMGIIKRADSQLLRWLCHGHIGLNLIWFAFKACVILVGNQNKIANSHKLVSPIKEDDRFIKFVSNWIKQQLMVAKSCKDTPIECFEILTGTKLIKTDLQA